MNPRVVVARQPSMRVAQLIVLCNVELVGGPNESAVLLEVHLHDTESRSVSGGVVEGDALVEIEVRLGKRVPFQLVQAHIVGKIDTQVSSSSYSPAGMLELFLVHIDRDIGSNEML